MMGLNDNLWSSDALMEINLNRLSIVVISWEIDAHDFSSTVKIFESRLLPTSVAASLVWKASKAILRGWTMAGAKRHPRPREGNIDGYWWRIYESGNLEVLES
ncbi:hypothetical protein Tco_1482253 [Tanacetum coccineum]